jgi:TetR/AcrR family transcriptional regulator, tetracycline repressor protein
MPERRSLRERRSILQQQAASERRQVLDRRRIVQAALELVDEQGLEALSMRKLGAALGVEAMALYYYIPNKAALVQAVAELVLDQLEVPVEPGGDWADIIRALARSFRQLGRAHPNVFPLLATIGFTDAAAIRPAEVVLEVLCRAGLSLSDAFVAFVTLKSYVVGHTVWALGNGDSADNEGQVCDTLPEFSETEYPRLAAFSDELAQVQLDAEFDRGLELLIDGIRGRINAKDPTFGEADPSQRSG